MTRMIEVRLIGHGAPEGQLLSRDALALIESFKDVVYRITRATAAASGLGRSNATVERLATVSVSWPTDRTALVFHIGDPEALDVDPLEQACERTFWQIMAALSAGERPEETSDPVADAVHRFAAALARAAAEVCMTTPGGRRQRLVTAQLDRRPWAPRLEPGERTTTYGYLEMIDLRSAHFRLRDAAGNRIELLDVQDAAVAAALVNRRVAATGRLAFGHGTHRHRMHAVRLAEDDARTRDNVTEALSTLTDLLSLSDAETSSRTTPGNPAPSGHTEHRDAPRRHDGNRARRRHVGGPALRVVPSDP